MKSIKLFYDYRGQDGVIRGASHVKELVNLIKKELQEGKDSSFISSCVNTHKVLAKNNELKNIKVDEQYFFQSPEQVKIEEVYKWFNLIEISFSNPSNVDKICEKFNKTSFTNCSVGACYRKLQAIDRWLNSAIQENNETEEDGKENFNITVEKMTEKEIPKTEIEKEVEKETPKNDEKTSLEVNEVKEEKEEVIESKEEKKEELSEKEVENETEDDDQKGEYEETSELTEKEEAIQVDNDEKAEKVETEKSETEDVSLVSLNEMRERYQALQKEISLAEIEKERIIKEALVTAKEIQDKAVIEAEKQKEDAKNKAISIIEDAVKEAVRKKEDAEKEAKRIKEDAESTAKEEIAKAESNINEKIAQAKVEAQAIKDKSLVDAEVYVNQRKKQLESFTAEIESTKKDTNKKSQKTRNETKTEIFKARGDIEDIKKELNGAQSAFGRVGDSINKVGSTLNGISEAIQKAIVSATGKINDIANEIEFKDAERATDLILLIYDQVFAMHNAYENYFVNEDTIHKDDVLDRLTVVEEVIEECLEEYGLSAFSTEQDTVIDTSKHDVSHTGGPAARTSVIDKSVKKGFVWDNGIIKVKEKVTVKPSKIDEATETDA